MSEQDAQSPSPAAQGRHTALVDVVLGVALVSVSFLFMWKLGRDGVLYGVPAIVMLVLLCLNAIRAHGGRGYAFFLGAGAVTAIVLRMTVGLPQ